MRILALSRSTSGHRGAGGMERSYESLLRALVERGHQVQLCTTSGGAEVRLPGVDVHEVRSRPGRYSLAWWWGSARVARRLCRERDVDVLLSISIAGATAAHVCPCPALAQSHGTFTMELSSSLTQGTAAGTVRAVANALRSVRDLLAYRAFAEVVAVGPLVARSLVRHVRLPAARVHLVRNEVRAADLPRDAPGGALWRDRLGVRENDVLVGFVGRLHPQKNPGFLVEMARVLHDGEPARAVRLVVVGDGPELDRLQREVDSAGVGDVLRLTSGLTAEQMPGLYSALDVVVMPGRRQEGLPMVVLEAEAFGLPVLGTVELATSAGSTVVPLPLDPGLWLAEALARGNAYDRSAGPAPDRFATAVDRYEVLLEGLA